MRRFFGLHSASDGTGPAASVVALTLCLAASVVATAMQPCPQRPAGDDAPSRTVAVAPTSSGAAASALDEGASCSGGWAAPAAVDPATLRAARADDRPTAGSVDASANDPGPSAVEMASPLPETRASPGTSSLFRIDASVDHLQTVVLRV
jgi:hypothetical protein